MKIALGLRGITYLEKYNHCHGLPSHTIDFRNTYPSIKENILNLYDNIDIFITTYNSTLNAELIDLYKPKNIKFKDYVTVPNHTIEKDTAIIYINHVLELLTMIEKYETENNITYDTCIITRSDLYFYQKLTEINLDYDVFNFPFWHMNGHIFSSEDNLIVFPRSKLVLLKTMLEDINNGNYNFHDKYIIGKHITLHQLGRFLLDKGETIKYLYGEKGDGAYDYPIYKFGRHIYGSAKVFNSIEDNLKVPMNRIYHANEDRINPQPIYLKNTN